MTVVSDARGGPVAALRRQFDDSFGAPPPPKPEETEAFLALRLGGDPYVVRLRDVAALVSRVPVSALPSPTPHLLGLAAIRGAVVPVFDFARWLGYTLAPAAPARWLLVCGHDSPVALAFHDLDGHLRIGRSALLAPPSHLPTRQFVAEGVRVGADARALISIPLVLEAIRERVTPARAPREP